MPTAPVSGACTWSGPKELQATVTDQLQKLQEQQFVKRLWEHDASLWKDDPKHQDVIRNRLGWLTVMEPMLAAVPAMEQFVDQVIADGLTHAVLLGMGGSSLAPEVLAHTFGYRGGFLNVQVLDNTSPDAVEAVAHAMDPARTLFLVSSKSGTTTESLSFFHFFHEWVRGARGDASGEHFIAITDPGTPLEKLAADYGFRHVFSNPPDIGGRYSALSYFGMVPAALMGIDIRALLELAGQAATAWGPGGEANNPSLYLGAAMGALARRGRDKLSLVLSPAIRSLGSWVEQLVAESTGKDGTGIVPVENETVGAPQVYDPDRLFVAVATEGDSDALPNAQLNALEQAGHPVLRWTLPDIPHMGADFLRWELATATAGAVLEVDPFDEPNVTESKDTTKDLLARFQQTGSLPQEQPVAEHGGLQLYGNVNGADLQACLAEFFASVTAGDYVALMAYLHRDDTVHERLTRIRLALRDALHKATTLGYGPRFLHSTGQLHKGGPNRGVFLQITADPVADLAIPGSPYSFGQLNRAQALGDLQVLQRHERRAVRVHIKGTPTVGLQALERVLRQALQALRA